MRAIPPPLWALLLLGDAWGLSLAPGLRELPLLRTRPIGLLVIVLALAIVLAAVAQFRRASTSSA